MKLLLVPKSLFLKSVLLNFIHIRNTSSYSLYQDNTISVATPVSFHFSGICKLQDIIKFKQHSASLMLISIQF